MSVDGWLQSIGHSSCSYVPGLISDQPVSPTAQSRLVLCQHPGPVSAPRPPPALRPVRPGPSEWLSADTRASCPQWGPGVTSARVHCTRGLRWVTWHDASGGVKSKNPQVQSRQSEEKRHCSECSVTRCQRVSECIARECGVCNAALQRWEACRHCSVLLPLHSERERELVVLRCSFYRSRCCGARCRLQARHHVIIWAPRVIQPFWSQLSRA